MLINGLDNNACIGCGGQKTRLADSHSSLYECADCRLVFDHPQPTLSTIREFYSKDEQYDHWLDQIDQRETLWERRVKVIEPYLTGDSLLDIGAGIGQFLNLLKKRISILEGTELSDRAVQIARERYSLHLHSGDMIALSLNKRYDVITLFHVLEHVPSPHDLLVRCHQLLNLGGVLIIAVPNDQDSLRNRVKGLFSPVFRRLFPRKFSCLGKYGIVKLLSDPTHKEIHLSHWNLKSLKACASLHGFVAIQRGLDPYYVADGARLFIEAIYYQACRVIYNIIGINLYDTCLIVLQKSHEPANYH